MTATRTTMRGPVVAYTSRRLKAASIASRVFSSAQTAASPEAEIDQPLGLSASAPLNRPAFDSGIESRADFHQKLGSSAVESPEWASVEPINPNW